MLKVHPGLHGTHLCIYKGWTYAILFRSSSVECNITNEQDSKIYLSVIFSKYDETFYDVLFVILN